MSRGFFMIWYDSFLISIAAVGRGNSGVTVAWDTWPVVGKLRNVKRMVRVTAVERWNCVEFKPLNMVLDVINRDQLLAPKTITLCALAGAALLALAATPVPRTIFQKFASSCFLEDIEVCIPQKVSPSVVSIQTPFGEGSGVVVNRDGLVISNAHVVAGGDSDALEIQLSDNRVFQGKVVGYAQEGVDLALIEIINPPEDLQPVDLGKAGTAKVGQGVFAIGNPGGLAHTVSQGSISKLNSVEGLVQLDISLNPGNSGGALINTNGELIGINTAVINSGDGNTGIGLAIPIESVKTFLADYQAGNISAPSPKEPVLLELGGAPLQDELSFEKSWRLDDGSYYNVYQFVGRAGEDIEIVMTSAGNIDPYLLVEAPDGQIVEDDDGAGGLNAGIVGELSVSGVYTILANTAEAGQLGNYTLVLSQP